MYMYIWMYICTYNVCVCVCVCVYVYTYTDIEHELLQLWPLCQITLHAQTYTITQIHAQTRTNTHKHAQTRTDIHKHKQPQTHTLSHTRTHTHTRTGRNTMPAWKGDLFVWVRTHASVRLFVRICEHLWAGACITRISLICLERDFLLQIDSFSWLYFTLARTCDSWSRDSTVIGRYNYQLRRECVYQIWWTHSRRSWWLYRPITVKSRVLM